ncbi:MAG: zinc-dependent alcohol dehydrogenase family protein [Candidatus Eisenbacteria bacterium]
MKAMLLRRQAPIEESPLEEAQVGVPHPGLGEVLVRVSACGLCHTDLHTVEGDIPLRKTPLIPGHQIVGFVEKLGESASRLKVGDKVGVAWLHWTCGKCRFCVRGDENLCENARFTGYDVNGGYAEYALAPSDFCYALPAEADPIQTAPLLCAGIIGYRSLKLSEAAEGETLALYGFGASAHVTIQVALSRGINVVVFSRSKEHRDLARRLGASWAGTMEESPPVAPERAIVFAPAGRLVNVALEAIDKGGTVALAGIHMDQVPPLDYEKHLYHEKKLRSVTASTRSDGREFIEEAFRIPVRTETEVFSLSDANRALRLLKESKINGAGVLRIG